MKQQIKYYALYDEATKGFITGTDLYGVSKTVDLFETRARAQFDVDSYYRDTLIRVKQINCAESSNKRPEIDQ